MKTETLAKYVTLKPEEEVFEVVREALAPHLPRLIVLGIFFLVPFFFMFPLFSIGLIGVVIFFALIIISIFLFVRKYVRWSGTMLVITDRRLVDIERRGLFDRVVTQTPFSQIDEVSYRIRGLIPTIFRYGSLRVQLSGSAADIEFRRARTPAQLHDLINDLRKVMADEARDIEETRVRRLTKKLSPQELEALEQKVRSKEVDEGLDALYKSDT